ncbi:MAG: DUF1329 domain-containing protein [Deltaproteobacteria bacterium]|nr:DUF1329 domain-containing protein [Deltaproteobacteria bacterium]
MSRKTWSVVCLLLLLVLSGCLMPAWGRAQEDRTEEKILAVFYPHRQGPPTIEGITPGMKIDKSNFQVAHEVLPPEILKYLQAGDFAITVQETTDMPVRQEYMKATLEHYGKAELGDGELKNYVAGLPFPLIDPQDPRVGEKVVWNHRYRDQGETQQMWPTNELRNSSGAVERAESFYVASKWGMHRPDPTKNLPQKDGEGVFNKMYGRVLAPADMEGSQMLFHSYDKDTLPRDQWMYDPGTRRIRKLVDNPYDSPGGGEVLQEDINGFDGYIHSYEWKYLGEKVVLAPGPIKTAEPTWGGRANWYPVDPWELRRAVVVEGRPKGSHPLYSRRVLYVDLQTYGTLYMLTYDRQGNHKRTFFLVYLHPALKLGNNNEEWIPQMAAEGTIDYQRERASVFQTHKVVQNEPLEDKMFNMGALMRQGK